MRKGPIIVDVISQYQILPDKDDRLLASRKNSVGATLPKHSHSDAPWGKAKEEDVGKMEGKTTRYEEQHH